MKFAATFTAALASAAVASAARSSANTKRADSSLSYNITNPYYQQYPEQICPLWDAICNVISIAVALDSGTGKPGPDCTYNANASSGAVTASCSYAGVNDTTTDITSSVGALFTGTDIFKSV